MHRQRSGCFAMSRSRSRDPPSPRTHVSDAGEVSVPSHFWLEVANVLIRRYRHSPDEVVERVRALDEFAIRTIELDRSLWLLALDRMLQHGLSSYDAAYLALAEVTRGHGCSPSDASLERLPARARSVWAPSSAAEGPSPLRHAGTRARFGPTSANTWRRSAGDRPPHARLLLFGDALEGLLVGLHVNESACLGVALDGVPGWCRGLGATLHCADPVAGTRVLRHPSLMHASQLQPLVEPQLRHL